VLRKEEEEVVVEQTEAVEMKEATLAAAVVVLVEVQPYLLFVTLAVVEEAFLWIDWQ